MTTTQLAQLALEFWRASGPRTLSRLDSLIDSVAESYFGASAGWKRSEIAEVITQARQLAHTRVNAWEVR